MLPRDFLNEGVLMGFPSGKSFMKFGSDDRNDQTSHRSFIWGFSRPHDEVYRKDWHRLDGIVCSFTEPLISLAKNQNPNSALL